MTLRLSQRIALLTIMALPALGFASQQLSAKLGMDPPAAAQRAVHIGAADPTRVLHLAISMPFADETAIQQFVDSVSNPVDPNYRHFLTPEQVGQQFGLPKAQVQKVVNYLNSQGMKITLVSKNRLAILADATVAQAQSAFNTKIEEFSSTDPADAADPYRFTFTSTPSVPAELGNIVTNVSGMEDFTRPKKQYLTPSQARTLYGTATMYAGGSQGTGRTIGISSWDGFRLSNASAFISYYGLPTPSGGATSNVSIETIDGGSGTGKQNVEGDMDIQCTLAIAPLASIIIYDGYNGDLINVLTKEVNDNTADIITESYGWGLASATADSAHSLHLSMTAQGITYLAAAGDTGTTLTYPYPACEPEVLVVGGTSTTTDTAGDRTTEVGWPDGGGGWATAVTNTFNVKPTYQSSVGPSGVNYRLFPDIAANADPNTGYTMYLAAGTYPTFTIATSGVYDGFGGTSAASPTMAASLADAEEKIIAGGGLTANSAGKRRFGRINDLLYSYNGLSSVFYDVTSGTNGTLPSGATSTAAAGWDTVTGWGAMNFQGLVNKVLGMSTVSSLSLSASTIEGGNGTAITGTVTISAAAPTGGEVVTLTSSSASVTVPASVTVSAGATSATFTATTAAVASNTTATLTAAANGSSATASLALTPPHPTSLTLSSSSVTGGTSTTGTVTIAEKAPTGGVVVTLTSSNTSAATVPASVTVAAGATTATFTVTSVAVASTASVTITAASGNGSATAGLTVSAASISSLALSSTSLYGGLGNAVTGTVTLSGPAPAAGAVVTLSSSSASATLSASSITIASGKTSGTFTFTAASVSTTTTVTITATVGSAKATATATINPAVLSAVSVSSSSVVGGVTNPTVTVTLTSPAGPSGTVVTLSSSVTTAANFSAGTVTVAAGKTTATATVTSYAVNASTAVTLTATSSVSKTASLTVTAATLSSLTLSTSSLTGNGSTAVTGTITLTGPAGPSGMTITLKSSNTTAVPVPASITIAAGAKTATFTFTPAKVTTSTKVTITATLGTGSTTATLTDV